MAQDKYTKGLFIQRMLEQYTNEKKEEARKKARKKEAADKRRGTERHRREILRLKEREAKDKRRHYEKMRQLKRQEAQDARQQEKEYKQWLRELKQQIFEFRSQTKRALDLPDPIDRHDTLFKIQIDTESIEMSDLETIEDKEYHDKTLSMIEEGLLKIVKELSVDRTGIMSALYTACMDSDTAYGNIKAIEARVTAISDMSADALSQAYEGWISSLREALQVVEDRLLDAKLDTPPDFGRGIDWADFHTCLQDHTSIIRKFQLLVCFANVKGELSKEERNILNDQAGEWLISSKTVDHLIEKEAPLDEIAYTMDSESAAALFDSLFRVAAAKCDLLPIEETLIERIADSIGLDVPTRTMLVTKGKETYLDPVFEFQCLVALAKIDGTVDPEELKMFQEYAVACGIPSDKSTYILNNTASSLNPAIFSGSETRATHIISVLYSMATVDKEFETKEAHCIEKIGKAMGLPADTIKDILKNALETQKRDAQAKAEATERALAEAKATARKRAAQRKKQNALKVMRYLIVLGIIGFLMYVLIVFLISVIQGFFI